MSYIIIAIVSLVLGAAAGFYAGIKNAKSSKIAKAKEVFDSFQK